MKSKVTVTRFAVARIATDALFETTFERRAQAIKAAAVINGKSKPIVFVFKVRISAVLDGTSLTGGAQ